MPGTSKSPNPCRACLVNTAWNPPMVSILPRGKGQVFSGLWDPTWSSPPPSPFLSLCRPYWVGLSPDPPACQAVLTSRPLQLPEILMVHSPPSRSVVSGHLTVGFPVHRPSLFLVFSIILPAFCFPHSSYHYLSYTTYYIPFWNVSSLNVEILVYGICCYIYSEEKNAWQITVE